jgi:hypothetical protein
VSVGKSRSDWVSVISLRADEEAAAEATARIESMGSILDLEAKVNP